MRTLIGAIEPDDLVNATEAAAILGLARSRAISVYRRRYPDFPQPVIDKSTCVLWRRQDIERWNANRKMVEQP